MKNKIVSTSFFESRYKRFKKKFPSIETEMEDLKKQLLENPKTGTLITQNVYKIRLASSDKNKGKSGGFRIITYLVEENPTGYEINLMLIYDKSEDSSFDKPYLLKLIKSIFG